MKRKLLFAGALLVYGTGIAQIAPVGGGQGTNSIEYWSRSGNNQNGSNSNIFGTKWNSPIYTITGGISPAEVRTKLNGIFNGTSFPQYSINNYGWNQNVNTTGYMGLGVNSPIPGNQFLWSNKGPFSLLHLNGRNGTFVQELGYRPWMQAGITLTDNQDLSYMGMRRVGSGFDVTETVIAWSDNPSSTNGPDDFSIRFMGGSGNTAISTTNLQETGDLDGLHVARFAGTGEFGLGNTFGINAAGTPNNLYVRPQSLAHYSLSNVRSVWQQFTNRNTTIGSGTGETASDGLRIGIIGHTNVNVNGTAAVYNQENAALLFSTNVNTNSINVTNGSTQERVRIMSAGTPTNLAAGGMGIHNPAGIGTNLTRMAVSHNPAQPVTRPMSLLHLGYNTGLNSFPPGTDDGWRPWMDIGTFTSNGTDNVYVGLKAEGTDRLDAVVSWGDNQSAGPVSNEGPDNLRFIFTSTTTSATNPGDPVSTSTDGLEVARMHPGQASTLTNNYGMVGIGNFSANGTNTAPANAIDAKLDIDGDLRIRTVTQDNSLTQVLVIDPADHNRVHWADINLPAGNGFVDCTDTTAAADLTADVKTNLNNNNLYFEGNDLQGMNHIGIGYDCSQTLPAKLSTYQWHPAVVNQTTVAVSGINEDLSVTALTEHIGIQGKSLGAHTTTDYVQNKGGDFHAANAVANYAVFAYAEAGSQTASNNHAGVFRAVEGTETIGIRATGSYASGLNYGVMANGHGGTHAYGLYAVASGASTANYAAHLTGDVFANGNIVLTSDIHLKENITPLTDAGATLNSLNPVSFDYKHSGIYERMHMPQNMQYGLIAQEVEPVLPTLIKQGHYPAEYDSLGNETAAAIEFKTMNYEGLIPILVKGHQEQSTIIDSLQTANDSLQSQISGLNDRLSQLENCLSGILPLLCQLSQQPVEQNGSEAQEQLRHIMEVELSNGEAIVLDQNVPNPFAESTVITYRIPSSVQTAQIIFHDATGARIKSLDIHERGEGQLNVYANDLSTGMYTYSLVADGKIAATKRMLKQ